MVNEFCYKENVVDAMEGSEAMQSEVTELWIKKRRNGGMKKENKAKK